MDTRKDRLWRALPFVMALLLLTLLPLQGVSALFGREKEESCSADGAPVAENLELRVYRGVPYTGAFRAVDNEGGALAFEIVSQPKKGTASLTEDGLGFVYTPGGKLGTDSFTYTAADAEGNVSLPATVSITVERAASGVTYADMDGNAAYTAAVDLAEHGVLIGTKLGGSWFFEPERTVTRGEFVAMALAAMGLKAEQTGMTGFCDDGDIPSWAKGYAVSALNAGIISGTGTPEGTAFRARDAITLNEAAVVLNRLLRVTDVDLSDYDAADAWCAQAVANLQSVSVLESGRFSADELRSGVTRAQAAELLSAAITLSESRAPQGLFSAIFG